MGACILSDPRDDLIRRGDVLDMIDAESHGDEGLAVIDSRDILALPADPVAAAAVALAEKIHPHIVDISEDGPLYGCCACSHEWRDVESHEPHCALAAYRAAIAGRERGR